MCWGVWGGVGKYWRRCGEVCWGVAGDVGVWENVGEGVVKCVGVWGRS